MFWKRFYNLCLQNGKRPNPIGKEIGLSSGIISKINDIIDNLNDEERTISLWNLVSPIRELNNGLKHYEETEKKISDNIAQLNNEGLSKVADYTKDLVDSHNYDPS